MWSWTVRWLQPLLQRRVEVVALQLLLVETAMKFFSHLPTKTKILRTRTITSTGLSLLSCLGWECFILGRNGTGRLRALRSLGHIWRWVGSKFGVWRSRHQCQNFACDSERMETWRGSMLSVLVGSRDHKRLLHVGFCTILYRQHFRVLYLRWKNVPTMMVLGCTRLGSGS